MSQSSLASSDVVAELFHGLNETVHRVRSAALLADADHLALVVHADDRADAEERSHRRGDAAHASAALEELEIVRKEVLRVVIDLALRPFDELFGGLARFVQVADRAHEIVADDRNALGVDRVESALRELLEKLRNRFVHCAERNGHRRGEVHIQDVVALLEFGMEIVRVALRGDAAGRGQHALAQRLIERVRIKHVIVLVRPDRLCVDAVRHGDQMIPVFFRNFRRDVGIGIGKQSQHFFILLLKYNGEPAVRRQCG